MVKDLAERFGPDRPISGGGFGAGATRASYRADRERVRSYLADLALEDQGTCEPGGRQRRRNSPSRSACQTSIALDQPSPWQLVSMHLLWPRSRTPPTSYDVGPTPKRVMLKANSSAACAVRSAHRSGDWAVTRQASPRPRSQRR